MHCLKKCLHVSWQIAGVCVGIFAGVVLAAQLQLAGIGWLLTGIVLVVVACLRQRLWAVPLAIFGGMLVGLWRGSLEQTALTVYRPLIGKTLTLTGTVSDDSDLDKQGNTILRLKDIQFGDSHLPGALWITTTDRKISIQRSDKVTVHGKLQSSFGTFAGSMYRANVEKVLRPSPGDVALHLRDGFADNVRKAISEPESSLGIGYLVGQRRSLPPELDTALKTAGLTHIVVASGYNLTILVRLARRLFEKVSKYLATISSLGLIVGFIAITGMSPSMSRAGLVAGLSLAAWYYGRKFHPLVLLAFAVAVTVLINPSYAWGDVGWQLSFAAFAGVMILAPLLQSYYFGPKKPGIVRQVFGETLAATLATLPILLYTFGYISNVALPANLLILPLVPLAMLLTFIAGVGALLLPNLATLFGVPAQLLLDYMVQVAEYFAHLPWAKTELTIQPWSVALIYAGLIVFMIYMWHKTRLNLRDQNLIE